jgi:hypothetical protein
MEFETALEAGEEEKIHQFLDRNPYAFAHLYIDGLLFSKFRLADAYIPDFVAIGRKRWSQLLAPLVTFIEIERSNMPLFTKSGDPSAFLTHAIRQVQDWKKWVGDNRSFLHRKLTSLLVDNQPGDLADDNEESALQHEIRERLSYTIARGFADRYLVVAGRRLSMTIADRLRLTQMNDDLKGIQIITYDAIIEELLREIALKKSPRRGMREMSYLEF